MINFRINNEILHTICEFVERFFCETGQCQQFLVLWLLCRPITCNAHVSVMTLNKIKIYIHSKKLREIALFFQGKNAPNIGFKSRFHYIPDEILWRNDKNTISFNIHFSFLGPGDTHRVKIWVNQGLWQVSRLSYISCSTSRIMNSNHQKMSSQNIVPEEMKRSK